MNLGEDSSEIDCFSKLFDPEVISFLLESVNSFARKKVTMNTPPQMRSVYGRWVDITPHELDKFISVLIMMGIDRRPEIVDYWSMAPEFYTPWYHSMFARDRFQDIFHTMLHAGDEEAEGKDKIEPFMNLLLTKFRAAFYPFRELSIDEMVIGFKGRWQYKQYNASKPSKYHIKTFGLCDAATGYVINILTYFGSDTSYDPEADKTSGQAVQIFSTLLAHVGKGHKIFADRYYTTRALIDFLLEKHQYYTGTLQENRVGFAPQLKQLSLQHREMQWFLKSDDSILCVGFRDKKAKKKVLMVSTDAEVGTTQVKDRTKPTMVHIYNLSMNGCDLLDQKVSYYNIFSRKTVKWWKKLFFWLLEIAQVNAFIIHNLARGPQSKPASLKTFKLHLLSQLSERAAVTIPQPGEAPRRQPGRPAKASPMEPHRGLRHIVSYLKQDRACAFCSTPAKRIRTHFICLGCADQPHLHPKDCFQKYHKA